MKLKTNIATGHSALTEAATTTKIVVFSLTGEKPFAGSMYKVINTGYGRRQRDGGNYQYANSLALTNSFLYYLCGNYTSTYSSWNEHLIYRYDRWCSPRARRCWRPMRSAAG